MQHAIGNKAVVETKIQPKSVQARDLKTLRVLETPSNMSQGEDGSENFLL
jgi:hypothetical protein